MEPESAVSILPTAQHVISVLFEKECESVGLPITAAHCIADLSLPSGVRIEPGNIPCIRVSVEWLIHLAHNGRSEEIDRAIRRAVILLPRFTRTLSNNATRAAEYIETARTFRAVNANDFALPQQHFKIQLSITMTCPLTGEIENVHGLSLSNLQEELGHARHRLSVRVYQHDQIADLLDTIEAARLSRETYPEPSSMLLLTNPTETRMDLEYDDSTEEL